MNQKQLRRIEREEKKKIERHIDLICASTFFLMQYHYQETQRRRGLPTGNLWINTPKRREWIILYNISRSIRLAVARQLEQTRMDRAYKAWSIARGVEWENTQPRCNLPRNFILENLNFGRQGSAGIMVFGNCENRRCNRPLPVDRGCPLCLPERLEEIPQMILRAMSCTSEIHRERLVNPSLCSTCSREPQPELRLQIEYWEPCPYQQEEERRNEQEEREIAEILRQEEEERERLHQDEDNDDDGDQELNENNREEDNPEEIDVEQEEDEEDAPESEEDDEEYGEDIPESEGELYEEDDEEDEE